MIAARRPNVALIPVGAYEQHGAHLPVTTDTVIACAIAQGITERRPALRVAPVTISCSQEHAGFDGCMALSAQTLARVMADITQWTRRAGVSLTVIVNGHGGNYVLGNVVQELNVDEPRTLAGPTHTHWQAAARAARIETRFENDMHAGEIETSILLHLLPEAVQHEKIHDVMQSGPRTVTFYGVRHYSTQGVIGCPSKATAVKGKKLLESVIAELDADITKALTYQRLHAQRDAQ